MLIWIYVLTDILVVSLIVTWVMIHKLKPYKQIEYSHYTVEGNKLYLREIRYGRIKVLSGIVSLLTFIVLLILVVLHNFNG